MALPGETEAALRKEIENLKERLRLTEARLERSGRRGRENGMIPVLREFVELLPVPATILIFDDWKAGYFNSAFIRTTGYTKDCCRNRVEFRKKLYPDPDYRREIEAGITKWEAGSPGQARIVERRVTVNDGSTKDFIYHALPLSENRFLTLWFDITELKRTEEKFRESNHFIETVISSMGQGFMVYDPQLRYVKWNRFMENLTGFKEDEILGRLPWDVFPDLTEKGVDKLLKRALAGESVQSVRNYTGLAGEGSSTWLSATYTPHRDSEGRIRGVVTMITDITARKLAEETLKKSEKAYRLILDSVPDSVVITTLKEGRYLYVNKSYSQLTGYAREEVLGRTPLEIGLYQNPAQREHIIRSLSETGQISNLEVQHIDRDGKLFETLFSARKIWYENQDCLVGIGKDLREIRKSEEERKRLEEQLKQAQKMESIGTLAGGVAHDFNNILQVIGGYIQLLSQSDGIAAGNRGHLAQIDRAVRRAAGLVGQLLAFSRKLKPDLKPLDLNREIRQAVKMLERMIPKMVGIEIDLAADLKPIYGDSIQLEQVLLNLGANASDAMPKGGRLIIETKNISLTTGVEAHEAGVEPGEYALLTISDTGSGIEQELIGHIFDPFYTTKKTGQGTGLGLATAYGIITNHQGRIYCSSEPGNGTTFKIYLPSADFENEVGTDSSPAPPQPSSGGGETILIADDEKSILDISREILTQAGYGLLCAEDGETALEIFKRKSREIELVILDLNMPGMGGYRCLSELLRIDPGAKVIISSGYMEDDQVEGSMTLGAAGFIGKPYRFDELLLKVRTVLNLPDK